MIIETVEAVSPAEGYKGIVRASGSSEAEDLAGQIYLDPDFAAEEMRVAAEGAAVSKGNDGVEASAKVPGDVSTPVGDSPLEALEGITAEHRRLWDKVKKKLVAGLCKRDLNKGLEQLKVAKLAGDILSVVVRGQRQAWGLDALEGELRADDTEEFIQEMASLTVPSRADKAVE